MNLALVIVPDLAARLWEHGLDRQQKSHLLWLEDTALRIDQRNALALEVEAGPQLGRSQVIVHFSQPPDVFQCGHPHEHVAIRFVHGKQAQRDVNRSREGWSRGNVLSVKAPRRGMVATFGSTFDGRFIATLSIAGYAVNSAVKMPLDARVVEP